MVRVNNNDDAGSEYTTTMIKNYDVMSNGSYMVRAND